MNTRDVLEEISDQNISGVRQWQAEFKNAVCKFLTSNSKRCLLVETGPTQSCIATIFQVLDELKEKPKQEILKKYLASENQRLLEWKQYENAVKSLDHLPTITELFICQFKQPKVFTEDNNVVLRKMLNQVKTSTSEKAIFITSEEGILNEYLEMYEMEEFLKIDEFKRTVTSLIYADLWESASHNRLSDVKELLKNGVDLNSLYKPYDSTALHVASKKGHKDIVLTLLKHGAINSVNKNKETPLHLAAQKGHADVVTILLENDFNINSKGNAGWTALHDATYYGHNNVVKTLLQYGANINIQNQYGATPLHFAVRKNNWDIVKVLLDFKAEINIKDYLGETPLYAASTRDSYEIVEILLENGANVNTKNNENKTPLEAAIKNKHADIVELLSSDTK